MRFLVELAILLTYYIGIGVMWIGLLGVFGIWKFLNMEERMVKTAIILLGVFILMATITIIIT